MPLTPFHGLSLLFLYFKQKAKIDLLAMTVSATFVDLEVLYYILLGESFDHRIWHGYGLALTVCPLLVTLGVYVTERFFEGRLRSAYGFLRLKPIQVRYSLKTIYLCSLFGGFSHIFLDMFTHREMPYVIYPLVYGNPFYIEPISIIVELAVILLAIYSCISWIGE